MALIILAGSGMSADSNLETFYTGKKVVDRSEYIGYCSLESFRNNPNETWKYWFKLQSRYNESIPHLGYTKLHNLLSTKKLPYHIITTNCDGLFRKAGFENVVEINGTLYSYSCADFCSAHSYPLISLDQAPICPSCKGTTRPAMYLFDDLGFSNQQTTLTYLKYTKWLKNIPEADLTILEVGVGNTVKTLKREVSWLKRSFPGSKHINVNPYENTSADSEYYKMSAEEYLSSGLLEEALFLEVLTT